MDILNDRNAPSFKSKRERTRQNLIDAAFELFRQRGFDEVTIEEIAAAAGVSRRTFFRYFPSKEKVVFPFNESRIAAWREVIRGRTGGQPATFDDLKAVFSDIAQSWIDNKEIMIDSRRIVTGSSVLLGYDHAVNQKWERAIALELDGAALTADGEDAVPSLRSRMIAAMLIGAVRPAFDEWYATDGESDLVAMGEEGLKLVEEGLRDYLAQAPEDAG